MPLVDIPGGKAELRDKPTVGGRDLLQQAGFDILALLRTKLPQGTQIKTIADIAKIPASALNGRMIAGFQDVNRAGILAFLKSWSLAEALPTAATIDDMDIDVFDALAREVAPYITMGMFGVDFGIGEKGKNAKDPNSPTAPSPDSNVGSGAASVHSIYPTPEPIDTGENTSIDQSLEDLPTSNT
jgi:hypothetical protein